MNATEWIAKRRELIEAATEGPWRADGHEVAQDWTARPGPWREVSSNEVDCTGYCYGGTTRGVEREEDAALIADARTSLPRALDALETVLETLPPAGAEKFGPDFEAGVAKGWQLARAAIETALRVEISARID